MAAAGVVVQSPYAIPRGTVERHRSLPVANHRSQHPRKDSADGEPAAFATRTEIVAVLNPDVELADLAEDISEIGYPA
ncbi:hypothetical protein [Streptomyces sp. NPDC005262]|uniref:hypothetical protein n=1 Tax=Streptomyces sp. NPDC005262 TaxID=3364710 RepID=UPI00367C0443